MQCYVYKGQKHDDHYLYLREEIEKGTAPDIPPALLNLLGELTLVVDFDLSPNRELAQADVDQVIQDIRDHGYYLQMPKKDMRVVEDQFFN